MDNQQLRKGAANIVEVLHNVLYDIRLTAGGDGARIPEVNFSGRYHIETGEFTNIQVTVADNNPTITAAVEAPTVEASTQTDHIQRQVQNSGSRVTVTEQESS